MDKYKLFLSASIPTQGREYYGSTNDAAITGAVMAFTRVCAEYSIPFYFGGHPAVYWVFCLLLPFAPPVEFSISVYLCPWQQ